MGFFDKIKQGLSKTAASISNVFTGFSEIDDDFYDELEESLILADLGMDTTMKAMDGLRAKVKAGHLKTTEEARTALKEVLAEMLQVGDTALNLSTRPSVVLVIGVNGVGKTTTIGKIAHQLRDQGKKVLLCAADTFRPPPPTSWKSGPAAPEWRSSARTRARTPPRWSMTPSPPPRPGGPT